MISVITYSLKDYAGMHKTEETGMRLQRILLFVR